MKNKTTFTRRVRKVIENLLVKKYGAKRKLAKIVSRTFEKTSVTEKRVRMGLYPIDIDAIVCQYSQKSTSYVYKNNPS